MLFVDPLFLIFLVLVLFIYWSIAQQYLAQGVFVAGQFRLLRLLGLAVRRAAAVLVGI